MVPNGTFLAMHPSDELPLSALPFRPKALVDVPLLSPGWGSLKILGAKKLAPERFFKLGNASLGPSYV